MPISPRYGFTYLEDGETAPAEAVNEIVEMIEAGGGHFIFKDRDLSDPTALTPSAGDTYLVAAPGAGAWSGHAGDIAYRLNTAWLFIEAIEGFTAWVNDEDVFIGFDGSAWNLLATPSGVYVPLTYLDTDAALTANSDAKIASQKAVKSYVDAKVAGLSWKQAVRVATTAAGTLASSFENGDSVDGVTLATGDRILIKNQAAPAENGIYVVAASGAPARASDADAGAELVNATVYVSEGTTNADTQWTCTTNAAITVGSTSLAFAQLTSGGGGYTGGVQSTPILASAMTPRTTSGAASGSTETTTNKIMLSTLDFDPSTDEFAQFMFPMPKSWNEGTITAQFIWTASAGTATHVVVWGIQGVAISDDDVLDAAFGTAQTVSDALTATGDVMQSAFTSAMTIGGTPAEGDLVCFQVYRDADNGSDTLAADAKLIGIRLNFTTNASDDS